MLPLRLAVIGLGRIWLRVHQAQLAALRDVFVPVALCDSSAERRDAAAREAPQAAIFDDYRQALARPDIDAALVLTPLALNAPIALAALEAGKHVIMEKPIARSVAEGRELLAAARRAGRQLFVTEQLAYRHAEQALAALLARDAIGQVVFWDRVQHMEADTAQGALRYDEAPWRQSADFPLGALFDGGIHTIASLSAVFGPPTTVFASGTKLRAGYGAYDHVAMLFQYASGVIGTLSHATVLPSAQNHFHIHGAAGVIAVEPKRLVVERPGQPQDVVALPQENAYAAMWQALADALRHGGAPAYTPERALRDVATLEAVDQSIALGQRVQLAAFPDRE